MSKMNKLLWITIATVAVALILVATYSMGRDIVEVIPQWLTECIVGLCALAIGLVICSVFALGIIKIKEICEGE